MPDGGRLHLAARPVELGPGNGFDVRPGTYALLEVADNGCGMDAATLARACEPLFTTKRLGLGSGLGLAMAQGFARQSGGGIAIESQPGQGTTVMLILPLTTPPGEDEAAELPALCRSDELALLVEDDPEVRRVVRQQLIGLGHPVIEAENGAQAIDMITQIPDIALVLSDIVMPGGLNGHQLAAAARAARPGVRVILMSGYDAPGQAGPDPAQSILAKPFTRRELAQALQRTAPENP